MTVKPDDPRLKQAWDAFKSLEDTYKPMTLDSYQRASDVKAV